MKTVQELLELREKIKEKKPEFIRQEFPVRKKLEKKWRKPKGIHSKMRKKKHGKKVQPSVGFSSPKKVRGLSRDGLKPILVFTLKNLEKITNEDIIVLSKNIGMKKKLEILKKIKEKKLRILNVKNIDEKIKSLTEKFEKRVKDKKEKTKEGKKQEKPKETKEEKHEEEKETEEEKKKRLELEKRKVLEGKV